MRTLFFVETALLLQIGNAILSGEPLMWNSFAFVVKMLSRGEAVKNCVGSLITPSLIITVPECVKNETTHEKLKDFLIVTSGTNRTNETLLPSKFYEARLVEVAPRWALLKIQPLDVDEICPTNPAPKRVARLPLNPSVANPSSIHVNVGDLSETNCYMLAFNTVDDGANYVSKARLLRLSLERLKDENAQEKVGLYTTRIVNNSTACFDDMGAALICHIAEKEEDYMIGMFRFLNFLNGIGLNRTSLSYCTHAIEMVFDTFSDEPDLLRAIERHDYGGFFDVYEKCGYTEL